MTRGFTLLEVLVALAIGGMALSGAVALLAGLEDRAAAIEAAARRADRDANAERVLREIVGNLALNTDTFPSFAGDAREASFHTWCSGPSGWMVQCGVRLAFEPQGDTLALVLHLEESDSSVTRLRSGVRSGSLRYLVDPTQGGRWVERWSDLVPPSAMEVIVDRDTLLLTVWSGG